MAKKETDISLIRKYLNGELDARAMHQLEKRAQSDPFLMDAMEGYENSNFNQQDNLDDIAARLQQRVSEKKKGFIIPFRYMAAAASVLVVLTIGGLWLFRSNKPESKMMMIKADTSLPKLAATPPSEKSHSNREDIAVLKMPPKPERKLKTIPEPLAKNTVGPPVLGVKPPAVSDQLAEVEFKRKRTDSSSKDTTPLNEMVAMDYGTAKKKEVAASSPVLKEVAITKDRPIEARVKGVQVDSPTPTTGSMRAGSGLLSRNITGTVISNDDRLPLPGASVHIAGTKITAVTDQNGKFTLPAADSSKSKVIVSYIGYEAAQINTQNRDSLKTIALQPSNNSLSEVVTIGYGTKRSKSVTGSVVNMAAHPQNGQAAFDKYLKENAISPDGKTGVVTISFTVASDGSKNDFNITKGLSKAADQKAIDLIKDGPAWAGNTNGKPEKVTLKIRFVSK